MSILLTQRQAILILRTRVGLSERTAWELVKKMHTVPDGKREKVREADVEKVIRIYNEPVSFEPRKGVKPLSRKHRLALALAN